MCRVTVRLWFRGMIATASGAKWNLEAISISSVCNLLIRAVNRMTSDGKFYGISLILELMKTFRSEGLDDVGRVNPAISAYCPNPLRPLIIFKKVVLL